jgi:hypothetical protein
MEMGSYFMEMGSYFMEMGSYFMESYFIDRSIPCILCCRIPLDLLDRMLDQC